MVIHRALTDLNAAVLAEDYTEAARLCVAARTRRLGRSLTGAVPLAAQEEFDCGGRAGGRRSDHVAGSHARVAA